LAPIHPPSSRLFGPSKPIVFARSCGCYIYKRRGSAPCSLLPRLCKPLTNFGEVVLLAMAGSGSGSSPPCASCKVLRRRCTQECVFAPYFPPEDPHKFAIVHKAFGASNVSKMLQVRLMHSSINKHIINSPIELRYGSFDYSRNFLLSRERMR
jgi:hypothetical protein